MTTSPASAPARAFDRCVACHQIRLMDVYRDVVESVCDECKEDDRGTR